MQKLDDMPISKLCVCAPAIDDLELLGQTLYAVVCRFVDEVGIEDIQYCNDFINAEIEKYVSRFGQEDFLIDEFSCTDYMKFYFKYIREELQDEALFSELVMFNCFDAIAYKESLRLKKLMEKDPENYHFYKTFKDLMEEAANVEYYDAFDYLISFDDKYYRHPAKTTAFLSREAYRLESVMVPLYGKFVSLKADVDYFDPELVDVFKNENKKLERILPYYPRNK